MTPKALRDDNILGAVTWWLYHPDMLTNQYQTGFPPHNDQSYMDLLRCGIEQAAIDTYAQIAKNNGATIIRLHEVRIPTDDKGNIEIIQCLPKIEPGIWSNVDGTIPSTKEDQINRFERGPRWADNSCAMDCFMVIALLAEGGRCRADQLDTEFLLANAVLGTLPRLIIRKPWSRLTIAELGALRNILSEAIETDEEHNYKKGAYKSVVGIMSVLGSGMPQFNATWTSVSRCCPLGTWQFRLNENGKTRREMRVGINAHFSAGIDGDQSIEGIIAQTLRTRELLASKWEKIHKCGRKNCHKEAGEELQVIIDRPPPMLTLMHGFEQSVGAIKGTFENIKVRFPCWGKGGVESQLLNYEPWGFVRYYHGHFTLFATRIKRGQKDFIRYDGMAREGKFSSIPSLEDGLKDGGVGMMIYRVVEDL